MTALRAALLGAFMGSAAIAATPGAATPAGEASDDGSAWEALADVGVLAPGNRPAAAIGDTTAHIEGRVVDVTTGEPVEGATVRLLDPESQDPGDPRSRLEVSNAGGFFAFDGVPPRSWLLVVEHLAFEEVRELVPLSEAGQVASVTVRTQPVFLHLTPLHVTPDPGSQSLERRAAWERKERGRGRFITGEEIQERGLENFPTDLLIEGRAPRMVGDTWGVGRSCRAAIFIDGAPAAEWELETIRGAEVELVEIYRNALEAPPELGVDGCVIALWTRPDPETAAPFSWRRLGAAAVFLSVSAYVGRLLW